MICRRLRRARRARPARSRCSNGVPPLHDAVDQNASFKARMRCLLFSCGLRAAKAFRVPRRRAFVSRGLPGTEGWNGAAAFDEGRGTVRPNGGQWTASSTFRSKRRRAIPAAEPPGRLRGSWSREALFHWELATLALATFPHWQHSFHAPSFLGADARPRTRGSSDARLRRLIRRANAVA